MQKYHQSSFNKASKNASIRLQRYILNALCVKLNVVRAQVVTITNTTCPTATQDVRYYNYTYGTSCSKGTNNSEFLKIRSILELLSLQSNQ